MSAKHIDEKAILEQLHEVPKDRWGQVLAFICSLRDGQKAMHAEHTFTAVDLLQSGLVGMWEDRTDIGDNHEFARRLRKEAETRRRDS